MSTNVGRPSGHCTVCRHVERTRIELLVAGGASHTAVARQYALSADAVGRHWRNHVSDERRAVLVVGPVKQFALASQVAEESSSVIDHYKALRAGLWRLYDAALDAGDRTGGALIAGRLLTCLDAMGRITGQLATSPLVQQTQVNFFINDPGFARFQADLIRVLNRFPDAREAVVAEFARIEAAAAPPAMPALEHQADG